MKTINHPDLDGVLIINKPSGPSSNQCLEQIKRRFGLKGLGHAGTLDPLADGVLVVLSGQATKLSGYLLEGKKIYNGVLQLGLCTDTYDILGTITGQRPWEHVTETTIGEAISFWTTLDSQEVPAYSAAKHRGKPLYKIAREGKETPIKTKSINITLAEMLNADLPKVRFRVSCSAGTYIRSLVHSLGMRLECGATLRELTRECSHPFSLEQAVCLDKLLDGPGDLEQWLIPVGEALPHWPKFLLDQALAEKARNGNELSHTAIGQASGGKETSFRPGQRAMFMCRKADRDEPLALAEARLKGDLPVWTILRGLWRA